MEIPSRRKRKPPRSNWSFIRILGITLFVSGGALLTFVAIQTGNYRRLAALAVLLLFFGIGFNIANIRKSLPGLHTNRQELDLLLYVLMHVWA